VPYHQPKSLKGRRVKWSSHTSACPYCTPLFFYAYNYAALRRPSLLLLLTCSLGAFSHISQCMHHQHAAAAACVKQAPAAFYAVPVGLNRPRTGPIRRCRSAANSPLALAQRVLTVVLVVRVQKKCK
jgi:hypothetical protein